MSEAPLYGYRILDLTDEKGYLCGKILADIGADVIKIEPPEGDPGRNIGPFFHDIPDKEKSLYWFAYNINKRGITLNLITKDGIAIFKKLAKDADCIIESYRPGYMEELGLGYETLKQLNPEVILTSITPFGQDGPYKNYQATDATIMALSGLVFSCGDADRPPCGSSVIQAYLHGGLHAAAATMIAIWHKEMTGEGQCIDVSIQEAVYCTSIPHRQQWEIGNALVSRGARTRRGNVVVRAVWPCKDGYVTWRMTPGLTGHRVRYLVEWMAEENMAGDLIEINWKEVDVLKVSQESIDLWEDTWINFFKSHTRAELYEGALKRGVQLFPVSTSADLLDDSQLLARDFFSDVEHDELGTALKYPGAAYISTEIHPRTSFRAPLIGEHNKEIYGKDLGFSQEKLVILKTNNVI